MVYAQILNLIASMKYILKKYMYVHILSSALFAARQKNPQIIKETFFSVPISFFGCLPQMIEFSQITFTLSVWKRKYSIYSKSIALETSLSTVFFYIYLIMGKMNNCLYKINVRYDNFGLGSCTFEYGYRKNISDQRLAVTNKTGKQLNILSSDREFKMNSILMQKTKMINTNRYYHSYGYSCYSHWHVDRVIKSVIPRVADISKIAQHVQIHINW